MRQLPLLDIQSYYHHPKVFVEELRKACHNVGFFLLRHDLPRTLAEQQLQVTRAFFRLPENKKMQISYEKNPSFRGYMKLGVENTGGKVDIREQVELAAEYPEREIDPKAWPPYQRLKAKNPWPDDIQPTLQTTTLEYTKHVCRIADSLREALCLAIGLEKDAMDPLFQDGPHWASKLVCYPSDQDSSTDSMGVGAHTDTNFLTLVLQDDVGGLQVFSQGEWIDVRTDLGTSVLVCNLGEQAEILSDGYFLATPHRVLANTSTKERISVPIFYQPMLSATIQPIARDSLEWERPQESEKKHWRMSSNAMLSTVGENAFKSLARSHPKVFQRHHSDLQLLEDGHIIRKKDCE